MPTGPQDSTRVSPEEAIRRRVHEYMETVEVEGQGRGCVYFCSLSAVTPAEHVRIAVDAAKQFRAGERPWAGERNAGKSEIGLCAIFPE